MLTKATKLYGTFEMKVAIVAHFDPENTWDNNFLQILRVLGDVVDRTVVVTTAQGIPDLTGDLTSVTLVRRPNIGYDFYSYRVGMQLALAERDLEGVFILNSSIVMLDTARFRGLLDTISDSGQSIGARGLTASMQFGWHLQSYLLYFDLRNLPKGWLLDFFDQIEPVNSKFEVVLRYEIGLGHALKANNIAVNTVFEPTPAQAVAGAISYMRSLVRKDGRRIWFTKAFWHAWRDVNWTHFGATALASRFGIVKTEFLRGNPHRLHQDLVWDACDPNLRPDIELSLERTRRFYSASRSGLTELTCRFDPLGIILQSIESNRHGFANARAAVVVHLFYIELLDEILDELNNIVEPFDLYITTPFEADLPQIFDSTDRRRRGVTAVVCRNKGRDVGPFVALFRTGCLDKYDAVLKLHSKKSRYSDKGDFWRRELYSPLCGDSITSLLSIQLIRERGCGVLGPARYFLTNPKFWGANQERLGEILKTCEVHYEENNPELGFFAGTMFWFSPKAFAALHKATGRAVEFDLENGMQDGTLAHAWERAFCLLARSAGYRVSSVVLDGKDIFSFDSSCNKVPVLSADTV